MYTLSDEMRGTSSVRNREASPFPGSDVRSLGSARRQGNNTFTPGGNVNYANARRQGNDTFTPGGHVNYANARRQGNDTFTPGTHRAQTMTAGTSSAAAAAAARKKKTVSSDDANPFRLPPLSSAEKAYMVRKAKESSIALVDHAHTLDGPVEWQYTGKYRGIQMYRGEGARSEEDGMEYLCGVTTMMGTLAEVASYFDQSTTERMRAKKADDVLDCAVLYALEQSSAGSKNPFYRVAVKYTSFEGPSTFSRARDYVYLECQDTFRHASGRRGWVLSMHSIKLPHCPEMDGTVRGSMYHSGYVFVEAERPGYMDVMHSLQINFKATKRLPSFMLHSALKRRITSVIQISRAIQVARMGAHTLLRKQDLMPKSSRSVCANCARKFTLFIRKTRCRMCGQVVCQSCAPQVDWGVSDDASGANGSGAGASGSKKKTRICVQCYRTGGGVLAPLSTGTSKNSAESSDDDDDLPATDAEHPMHHDHSSPDHVHDDDDAAAVADGLEEQTEESVFAQSRFTRSADSLFSSFSSEFHIHDMSASKANGKTKPGAIGWSDMVGTSYDQPPDVMEDATFDADLALYDTKLHLTPEDTDEELDKRARRYDPDYRVTTTDESATPPPPPPPMAAPQHMSARSDHRLHDAKRYQAPMPPAPTLLAHQTSGKLVSIKDIRSNFMKGTVKGELPVAPPTAAAAVSSSPSAYDDNYISRPPSAILSKVRANRSRTIQFAPEGDYRSPEMMLAMQDEHAKRMAELSSATDKYNASLRVAEPERNSDDDEPFTLAHLEVPAPASRTDDAGASPRDGAGADGEQSAAAAAMDTSDLHDADADDDIYAPVSALELSQVRATRSRTIEFMPQFLLSAASETESEDDDARTSGSIPRFSEEPRVTEQYANLQIPMGDVVEMATTPPLGPNDAPPMRFSQTMVPILDFSTPERSSDVQSVASLTFEPRESRKFSDIPLLARSTSGSSVRESDLDLELLGRSTTVLMEQVRSHRVQATPLDDEPAYDRSTEIMKDIEAEHRRRMDELNRIALDYTGNRISRLHLVDEDRESIDTVECERLRRTSTLSQQQPLESLDEDTGDGDDDVAPFAMSTLSTTAARASETSMPEARVSSPKGFHGLSSLEFMPEDDLAFVETTEETKAPVRAPPPPSRSTGLAFSLDLLEPQRDTIDAKIGSPRASTVFDDELLSRSTTVIMDQVRSHRERRAPNDYDDLSQSQLRSTAIMKDKEAAHRERMAELNRIALESVGARVSTFANRASEDGSGGFATHGTGDESDDDGSSDKRLLRRVNTTHLEDADWRATTVLDRYQSAHEAKMQELRDKVRALDDACRASMASIFSADELDFAELDAEAEAAAAATPAPVAAPPKYKHRDVPPPPVPTSSRIGRGRPDENNARIANLYSVKHLKPVAARRAPVVMHERVSTHTLYEQIAQLTQLQSQMALAKDAEDEEAFKQRIKEQYQLLRTLKLRGY